MRMNNILYCLCVLFVAFFCASCLDVEVALRVRRNETVSLKVVYRIAHDLATLGSYERSVLKSLPLTESDFIRLAASHTDVRLKRYRQRNRGERHEIVAQLHFASIAVFNDFFGAQDAIPLHIRSASQGVGGRLSFPLAFALPVAEETENDLWQLFARDFFSQYAVTLKVMAPKRISTANNGEANGRRATARYQLSQLISSDADVIWRVEW